MKERYLYPILNNAQRLLGFLNRNISSSTYGCFDRDYWHYNIVDFSCARKQEAVLTLTLLYLINCKDNVFYQRDEILEYIFAGMNFWCQIQNRNGSFNEWYPNENSFVVTAFSSYAVSESLLLLGEKVPVDIRQKVINALAKAGLWLSRRDETRVMNQQAGAVIALYNIFLLTEDVRFSEASNDKVNILKDRQSDEGWFIEYGGPDIGYLSLAIDYLYKYYKKTKDVRVAEMVKKATGFIKHFIQPDLKAGGEYGSRNTEYLIPHGFELLSRENEDACFVASTIRKSILDTSSFPNLFDDRYFTYVGYTWLQAYLDANPDLGSIEENIKRHFGTPFKRFFPESGLLIINDPEKHIIVNTKKGGTFRLFDKRIKKAYSDSGILVRSSDGWYTAGWLSNPERVINEDSLTIKGKMWMISDKTLSPFKNILLRLFQMVFGRSTVISLWVKERLRDVLITKTKASSISFMRNIVFKDHGEGLITVRDFVNADKKPLYTVVVYTNDAHIYVPSSRYYVTNKDKPFKKEFSLPVKEMEIEWTIGRGSLPEFSVRK